VITFKVLSDNQRIAKLCDDRFSRLIGPGVVLLLTLPNTKFYRIAVGDRGQFVSANQAQFGDVLLPVDVRGPAISGAVRVIGFGDCTVLVSEGNVDAPVTEDALIEEETVRPHFKARNFWIGLPVVLFFCVITWMGFLYAANQIRTERLVYKHGIIATGTVIKKILYDSNDSSEQNQYIIYSFQAPAGSTVRKEIRVGPEFWDHLKDNGPISIRYVPDKPELSLPDGWHMTEFYYWAGGVSLAGALFFSTVFIGMLVKKFSGGYHGETHPFLGKRPPL
jgi:hypothetical protein